MAWVRRDEKFRSSSPDDELSASTKSRSAAAAPASTGAQGSAQLGAAQTLLQTVLASSATRKEKSSIAAAICAQVLQQPRPDRTESELLPRNERHQGAQIHHPPEIIAEVDLRQDLLQPALAWQTAHRASHMRCLLQAPTAHGTTNSARAAIKKAMTMRDFALHSFGGMADSQTAAPPLGMMANTEECLVHRSNSEAEDLQGYTVTAEADFRQRIFDDVTGSIKAQLLALEARIGERFAHMLDENFKQAVDRQSGLAPVSFVEAP